MSKIIVILAGGLGNQMFQYALGRAISIKKNGNLVLDISNFQHDSFYKRNYELKCFKIPVNIKTKLSKNKISIARLLFRFSENLKLIHRILKPFIALEVNSNYAEPSLKSSTSSKFYIVGYWQDERYFREIRSTIINEFSLHGNFSGKNKLLSNQIKNTKNPVAIHVRRLHGVETKINATPDKESEKLKWAVSADYYIKAIDKISMEVDKPTFFIFSDYPIWAKENFNIQHHSVFLNNDRGEDYEDIILMSLCKHHIIANSSFSWWGAWLSESPHQIVIAPKNATGTPNIPQRWITL